MTEPSQYFKGRTVQEQMDEVIGYVDKRAEEVAAAKADAVLQPAEQAKTAAQAAAEAAEAAKDTTLAALPAIQQDISGLKAEDAALDGRLDTVELKVQTAEGNIVTIQGKITAIENKNTQQDNAIAALQTADEQNVKLTGANAIGNYAVLLTGNQDKSGILNTLSRIDYPNRSIDIFNPPTYVSRGIGEVKSGPGDANTAMREEFTFASGGNTLAFAVHCGDTDGITDHTATLMLTVFRDGKARLQLQRESGTVQIVPQG